MLLLRTNPDKEKQEVVRVKGVISKIWINELEDGRKYAALLIGKEKYTTWDKKYLQLLETGDIEEGDAIQFDMKKSGKYLNVVNIEKYAPIDSNSLEPLENETNDDSYSFVEKKDREIARMSSLKAALYLTKDMINTPLKIRADETINVARKFEKYITNDDFSFPEEPEEDEEKRKPE
jgi:hypothetical protein